MGATYSGLSGEQNTGKACTTLTYEDLKFHTPIESSPLVGLVVGNRPSLPIAQGCHPLWVDLMTQHKITLDDFGSSLA